MGLKIGFTGTRSGMTQAQLDKFLELAIKLGGTEFHHGDCIGADTQAAHLMNGKMRIVKHPPKNTSCQAHNPYFDEERKPDTYFARNRNIVKESDVLVGTPWQEEPPDKGTGGGTWYTIRWAHKHGKPVYIIFPDGRVHEINVKKGESPCTES